MRIGSRSSKLAKAQVAEVMQFLGSSFPYEHMTYATQGDIDKQTPLTDAPADNFFTDTIDQAVLSGAVDVGIHSAKDLPQKLTSGLEILALTASLDDTDAWVSPTAWELLSSGARVGTSSLLRQSMALALRPDIQMINIRGCIEDRLKLVEQKEVDGIIVATCALKRLGLSHLIRDVFPWPGMALQGQLAVVGRRGNQQVKDVFKLLDVRVKYGKVTLVGAGPGDPELITIKAIKALEEADCVFYDYLVDKNILKYAPKAEQIYAGKRKGDHTLSQHQLSQMLKNQAIQGKNVIRLKGGDPLVFGRGADEIAYLSSYHIKVNVIPGISSATGIPSSLGLPLTARGLSSSVAFVSGHEEDEDKKDEQPVRIPAADTIVFLMGLTKLKRIVQALIQAQWARETPILVISRGARLDQQIVQGTIENIEIRVNSASLKPPALIIAGNVVQLFKLRPRRVLLHCGTNPELYQDLGHIVPWPMIEIKPIRFSVDQRTRIKEDFCQSHMVVLTSPSSVEFFMRIILELVPGTLVSQKIFAVIGRETARALDEFAITAQLISNEETAQGLFKTLSSNVQLRGKVIFFPRSSLPNPFLKESLESQGAKVQELPVYSNTKPPRRKLPDIKYHGVIFTSPSTLKNFLEDYEVIPAEWVILAKGPATQAALAEAGYKSRVIS